MSSRAERRRRAHAAQRSGPTPVPAAAPRGRLAWQHACALGLLAVLVLVRGEWMRRQITWYLAVDQFGYFTFAHDILAGRLLHVWPPADAFASGLPPRTDLLAQTYIWDHGRIYSRYAPGFPLLLAAWLAILGDDRAHYLNPLLYLGSLVLVAAIARRLTRSWWRGLAASALVVISPAFFFLWGLTLTRDVATHVVAFTGLYLLLPAGARRLDGRRTAAAGVALGFAAAMRPDAVMYLLAAIPLAALRWRRERGGGRALRRALRVAVPGYVLGIAPLLVYDWAAAGSLLPPQSVELDKVLGAVRDLLVPSAYALGWHGGTLTPVQGGALQLRNLRAVLPGNLAIFTGSYGPVLCGAALWGAVVALAVRPALFLLAVPYSVATLLFFSCWVRPDTRYLIGVDLWVALLIVEGTVGSLDLLRALWRRRQATAARVLGGLIALALVVGATLAPANPRVAPATWLLVLGAGGGALATALWPRRRLAGLVAPLVAVGLAGMGAWHDWNALGRNASFQRPQMLTARATLDRAVEPDGVVITTEDVGRPAENIEHYGHRWALYLTDLERWHMTVKQACLRLIMAGMRPYLLLPADVFATHTLVRDLAQGATVAEVADIPPPLAMSYFVAAPFHRGVHMGLWRVSLDPQAEEFLHGLWKPGHPASGGPPHSP
ncbi:MAG TPA: hypothetical protein VKW76_09440 [Candidatus Binatia bacterium]|nr:hypothetical protein [Candidatus Binatia bacterium]